MTAKIDNLIENLSSLSILEALELVKKLENRWGVSSIVRVSRLFTPYPAEPVEPPQTEFDVVITECGPKKIEVIKIIRSLTTLGLKEAKEAAETPGYILFNGVDNEIAVSTKDLLERAGAKVKIV